MTENGQENSQGQREEHADGQGEEPTYVGERDSTHGADSSQEKPHNTWSGAASGSGASPAGQTPPADAPTQGAQAQNSAQAYPSAPPSAYPSAGYPSAPQQQSYPSGASSQPSYPGGVPQGGWSAPSQPGSQYGQPQSGGQNPQYGQPQQSWQSQQQGSPGYSSSPYQQAPQYTPGQPRSWSSSPQQYQQGGAPYGSAPQGGQSTPYRTAAPQQGSAPSAFGTTPFGQASAPKKNVSPQLTPLEKYGPFVPALLILIAAFLTWATFKSGGQTVSLNGVGGNSNSSNPDLGGAKSTGGWLNIVCALGLVGVATAAILGKLKASAAALATAGLSALTLIIALIQFANINSIVSSDAGDGYSGTVGFGVWLTLFASLVGIGLGIYGFLSARKRRTSAGDRASTPSAQSSSNTGNPSQAGSPFDGGKNPWGNSSAQHQGSQGASSPQGQPQGYQSAPSPWGQQNR